MPFDSPARKLLQEIEDAKLNTTCLRAVYPEKGRELSLVHTKLDEARLWLQDAIGYERPADSA